VKPRAPADYGARSPSVGGCRGVDYLSASEITERLAQGIVHLGVTARTVFAKMMRRRCGCQGSLIEGSGGVGDFGNAKWWSQVPAGLDRVTAWRPVDDVATAFRRSTTKDAGRHNTSISRVTSSPRPGVTDYRIVVESSGATEGAPAAGTAESSSTSPAAGQRSPPMS